MATTLWSAFTNDVLLDTPNCSAIVAEQAVRDSAIDFCRRTLVWVYDPGVIAVGAALADYQLEPPAGTKVERVLEVKVDGRQLEPKSPDELNGYYADWAAEKGQPQFYASSEDSETIWLVPRPTQTGQMSQRLALRPTQASTGLDSILYERYRDAIVCGALAALFMMPNKSWSNPALGLDRRLQYNRRVGSVQAEALRGFTRAALRTSPRVFA